MIEFRILGSLDLRPLGGGAIASVLSRPKRVALLAYLALADGALCRRDKLLAVFWPELDADHARGALRQALSVLRLALGESVIVSRGAEEVGIAAGQLWCDAAAFDAAMRAGEVSRAAELYRGDLLDGFFIPGAPEFERWLDQARSRLRQEAAEATCTLAEAAARTGDAGLSKRLARRALDLAPDDETILRRAVQALDGVGDRAAAVIAYDAFAARLSDEYGVRPAPETQELLAAVRSRQVAALVLSAGHVGGDQPGDATGPTPPGRLALRRPAAVAAVLVGVLAADGSVATSSVGHALMPNRVVVVPLENLTGDTALAPIGRITAEWITDGLVRNGIAQAVPWVSVGVATAASAGGNSSPARDAVRELAEQTKAGLVIVGSYARDDTAVVLSARLVDLSEGLIAGSVGPVRAARDDPMPGIETLRQRLLGLVASRLQPRVARWIGSGGTVPSYEAYVEMVLGLEAYSKPALDRPLSNYEAALAHWLRAVQLDSAFLPVAGLDVVTAFNELGRTAQRDSMIRVLERVRDRMTLAQRYRLDTWQVKDARRAYQIQKKLVALEADERARANLASMAMVLGRHAEAVELFELNLDGWAATVNPWHTWKNYTAALHFLGRHHKELRMAQEARRRNPDDPNYMLVQAEALAPLGRAREVRVLLDSLALLGPARLTGGALYTVAQEYWLHGHEDDAHDMFDQTLKWLESRANTEKQTPEYGRFFYNVLYYSRRWREAAEFLGRPGNGVVPDGPSGDLAQWAEAGRLAARLGNREQAVEMMDRLSDLQVSTEFNGFAPALARARIAAILGDRDAAVRLLGEAIAHGYNLKLLHRAMNDFESLRGYAPFDALVRPRG